MGVATTQVPSMFGTIANAAGAGFSAYAQSTAGTSSGIGSGGGGNTNLYGGSYSMEANSLGGVDKVWSTG